MDVNLLSNLGAYSAQVLCLAALGTLASVVFRVDAPGVRYAYWRGLLALCVVLPWLQGRHAVVPRAALPIDDGVAAITVVEAAPSGGVVPAAGIDSLYLAGFLILGGIVLRIMWLAVGMVHLRRLRRMGHAAPPSALVDDVQEAIGARAEVRYVAGLDQPVTFGALRPVILLPESLRAHAPDIQRAVLCHELLHVQRRDWIFVLVEEAVRAALWFHPAIWWLIGRVQLAREEVVDELTVLATGRRRTYVEALMTFADDTPLAPAAAFARRRHLFRRMVLISKEAVMSSRRIVLSCAAMALVVAVGSWNVVGAFPMTREALPQAETLRGPGPLEQAAKPITPENPIPRRVSATDPIYPSESQPATGMVTLAVTLDSLGRVAEVRPVGVNLRRQGPNGFSVGYSNYLGFDLDQMFRSTSPGSDLDAVKSVASAFISSSLQAAREWRYDPPADAPLSFDVRIAFSPTRPATVTQGPRMAGTSGMARGVGRGVSGGVGGGVGGGVAGGTRGAAPAEAGQAPLRVGGNIKPPIKTRDVRPVYPEEARAARVQGVVIIEATVGPDGDVIDARVLRSIPMLDEAAVDAVMQWGFTPTLMNGVPVPVIMTVTVNFTLQ